MATPARNSAWCHRCARATTRSCGKAVKRPLATYGQGWTGWGWGWGGGWVGRGRGYVRRVGSWCGVVLVGADPVVLLLEGLGSEVWVKRLWIWGYRQVYARGICPRRNHPIEGVVGRRFELLMGKEIESGWGGGVPIVDVIAPVLFYDTGLCFFVRAIVACCPPRARA
eukprot:scaffold21497_cov128-Isochrysis_galbana.AAC.1